MIIRRFKNRKQKIVTLVSWILEICCIFSAWNRWESYDDLRGALILGETFLVIGLIHLSYTIVGKKDFDFRIKVLEKNFLLELGWRDTRRISREFELEKKWRKVYIKDKYGAEIELPYTRKLWLFLNEIKK